jgi:Xaa-Pro aminopeptidase
MPQRRLDAVVIGAPHHVYYFSAHWTFVFHQSAFVLFADGRSVLMTANTPNTSAAADEVISYEANWRGTLRQDQPRELAQAIVREIAGRRPARIGIDASVTTSQVAMMFDGHCEPIDDHLFQMRRVKDADELELMRKGIKCCEAMYKRAREIIEPGVPELYVYGELHSAAVKEAGEPLQPAYLGNDYACGVPGGPARWDRLAGDGELYILDLGPAYRGYFSDNARTFCVNRKPTDAQYQAWEHVTSCFKIVEQLARPGRRCVEIFDAVDQHLRLVRKTGMGHHLGHGVGLQAHEYPHLNPEWDDVLMEGEIFTAEPGQYGDELRGGIRIENDYLVTKTGVEKMIDTPVEM